MFMKNLVGSYSRKLFGAHLSSQTFLVEVCSNQLKSKEMSWLSTLYIRVGPLIEQHQRQEDVSFSMCLWSAL